MRIDAELLMSAGEIHDRIRRELPSTRTSLIIATALAKEARFDLGGESQSLLTILDELIGRGVNVFLLLGGCPSLPFIRSWIEYASTREKLQWRLCARNHLKALIIDERVIYYGSANVTGAGMGARHDGKRNYEMGTWTRDQRVIQMVARAIRKIWLEEGCDDCMARKTCYNEHAKLFSAIETPNTIVQGTRTRVRGAF